MAEVKWIKIVTDIFDDEKTQLIESLPEADGIIVIWFKLLCLAGKQNNGGVFMLNDRIAYTEEMLATIFRRPINTVRLALHTFEQYGMIEIVNNVITIPNWEKHQSLDKLEQAREKTRQRVAAHRERQKALTEGTEICNVTVTECNVDRIEEDKNKNKNNKKERKKAASSYDEIVTGYTESKELQQALYEFIKMRKLIKKPLTDYALNRILSKLDEMTTDCGRKIAILNQSICNNWQGIFELKDGSYSPAKSSCKAADNVKQPSNYDAARNNPDYYGF